MEIVSVLVKLTGYPPYGVKMPYPQAVRAAIRQARRDLGTVEIREGTVVVHTFEELKLASEQLGIEGFTELEAVEQAHHATRQLRPETVKEEEGDERTQ